MRKTENNTSFLDLLLILVVMYGAMLILALPFLNPIADEGVVTPDGLVMITLRWPNGSVKDMDLWVKGPDGTVVSYQRKDGRYILLDRDDLGSANDSIIVDGIVKIIPRNLETVMITDLQDGEYVVNVHHFSGVAGEVEVTVEVTGLMPYRIWFTGDATLSSRQELTVVSFTVEGGRITDVRTDLQVRLRSAGGSVP
jgi:hypothetical protein